MSLCGQRVELHSLQKAELNGRRGVALSYDTEKGRYAVVLDESAESLAIKEANLRPLEAPAPEGAAGDA
eukprot:CAMPEP_0119377254 /NCGR_PEP_ID=MMETSP1334-20130426/43927_1 /TAXON_ID=127549 /ORGANISM="Calcidiscus leptoporus, Strain RCC1130" /LENGTH=68 /DNA_ID=CAMNT_0007396095 /DNA_START=26 /DNA_END=229 /DNA_ORIENTATION=+